MRVHMHRFAIPARGCFRNIASLSFVLTCAFPIFTHATELININTADATLLDTLPGIGPSKAAAIVDYRTQHGTFLRSEDIQNVSGIGPSTYTGLAPLITVGDISASSTPMTSTTLAAPSTPISSGSASTYVPPPSALSIDIDGNQNAFMEVPLHLLAHVTVKSGAAYPSAQISWGFGDGSSAIGSSVEKTYRYAGTYLVRATASDGATSAQSEFTVVVKPSEVRILSVSGEGIMIANDSPERLDLSNWRLVSGTGIFRIPDGTVMLSEASVLFPSAITNLPTALDARLVHPNGTIAAQYPLQANASIAEASPVGETVSNALASAMDAQLSEPAQGSTEYVRQREKVPSNNLSGTAHEKSILAPTTTAEPAAVGAIASATSPFAGMHTPSFLHSPWTLGFLSVIALAGGAFILL